MNSHPQSRSLVAAFTRVEMFAVSAVIVIVLGLLFPLVQLPKHHPAKSEARACCTQITAAVNSYYKEYGHYPLGKYRADPQGGDFIFGYSHGAAVGHGVSNAELFDILRNSDSRGATAPGQPNPYNPKGIVFFDAKDASDPRKPKSGFAPKGGSGTPGAFLDPWGTEYFIAIDADADGQIDGNPLTKRVLPYHDFAAPNHPRTGVAVFSLGKDLKPGTRGDGWFKNPKAPAFSDDILSWQ